MALGKSASICTRSTHITGWSPTITGRFLIDDDLQELARSSHQRWVSDDSGGRTTDFSLDSVEEMEFLGDGLLAEAGENVRQPLETNFSLVAGCETNVVGAGWGSTAQRQPSSGEQRFPRVGVAVANPDSARGHTHLGGNFQQPQPDRSRLGLGPLGSTQSDAPQRVQQDVSQG